MCGVSRVWHGLPGQRTVLSSQAEAIYCGILPTDQLLMAHCCHWYRPHPYQSRAVGGLISTCHEGHLAAHFIINQIHHVPYWQPIECNKQCYLIALMKHLHVFYHPFGPPSGLGWANVMGPARSVGTEFEKGGYLVCPPLLHAILLCPPQPTLQLLQHMKANRGHAALIPATDMIFWSMAGASEGPFPTLLLFPASSPLIVNPTPPHSSHSKAWATPNVSDVSLAIVHGWPHLKGWLVPRPAPYNGLLSHSDLFSAFSPLHEERTLSLAFLALWLCWRSWCQS